MDLPNQTDQDTSYKNLYQNPEPVNSKTTNQFAVASLSMGILTIITTVLCTVFLPFLFSGLSIIFAVLSMNRFMVSLLTKSGKIPLNPFNNERL